MQKLKHKQINYIMQNFIILGELCKQELSDLV